MTRLNTFTFIILIILMSLYTIYAIWQIFHFKRLISGLFGTAAVIAGGTGLYIVAPFIAAAILWMLKILGIIAIIFVLIVIFGN